MSTLIASLYPVPPYNFDLLLNVLSRYTKPAINIVHDNAFWRTIRVGDELALLKVTSGGTITEPQLDVSLTQSTGEVEPEILITSIRRTLGVDSNLAGFYEYAQQEPTLWKVIAPLYGLPIVRTKTVFESLVFIIIEQQISWVAAQLAQRQLMEWAGNCLVHNNLAHYDAPSPEQLAQATIDDLKPLKITFRRMQLLIDIAQEIVQGTIDLERLYGQSVEDAYAWLCSIKGIGHWTATHTIERALGQYAYLGYNDVALQAAANRYFYDAEGKLSEEALQETYNTFGEFAGMAAHFTIIRWVLDKYAP